MGDQSEDGYYNFPDPIKCECDSLGSTGKTCDADGKCTCKTSHTGDKCDKCTSGHYGIICKACECDVNGSKSVECDENGKCTCNDNIIGDKCNECADGYAKFPDCTACGCNTFGSKKCEETGKSADTCNKETGQCSCKCNVEGTKCDKCKPSFYGFPKTEGMDTNCLACFCNHHGSKNDKCDQTTGQCECKNGYTSKTCDECDKGYSGFPDCKGATA